MTEIENTLTALVRGGLHGGAPLPPGTDWEALFRLCRRHNLMGFLYRAAEKSDGVSVEVRDKINRAYTLSVGQQVQQDYYREKIADALRCAGIPYLPLKGEVLRKLYPSPDLRFSCDIDFLYPRERRGEVNAILSGLGFAQAQSDLHNDVFRLGAVTVEPHFELTDQGDPVRRYYRDVWARLKTDDGAEYRFTDEDFYIFHLLHMYKHMLHGGAGVRAFIDLWLWKNAHPEMDAAYLAGEYKTLGIEKFAGVCERLSRVWFDGEAGDADTDLLTDYIVVGGAYGNKEQSAQIQAAASGSSSGKRFRYLWGRIFLPYRFMRLRYPLLARLPFLLPFFWVVRWVQALFPRKRERIRQEWKIAARLTDKKSAEDAARIWALLS